MESVVLVIHLFLALGIIGLVLLQRSEGGGLGIGGGSGGLGNFASAQGTASALAKITGLFAAGFFCTSLILGVMAGQHRSVGSELKKALENIPAAAEKAAEAVPGAPAVPANDTVTGGSAPVTSEPAASVPEAEAPTSETSAPDTSATENSAPSVPIAR